MKRTAVINVVGLTGPLVGPAMPHTARFASRHRITRISPAFPAVTCTAQSVYLTGKEPTEHGIVGNGWYNRELSEVQFWKQSNRVVTSPKIWDRMKAADPTFTCANLFWWYNMYSTVDYSITPRPAYPADGRKVFDIYSHPAAIRPEIKKDLGDFPFPTFWGPAAGIKTPQGGPDAASRWIANSAKWVEQRHSPTLSLVYLPHLDYAHQRSGPGAEEPLREIDAILGDLISFYESRSVQLILLSEYGITPVNTPIHINCLLRQEGWITVREELGLEVLDCGASKAFAVADHQVAHIYLNDLSLKDKVRQLLERQTNIESVLDGGALNHPRAGDLIAVSKKNAWFTYYYWLDDSLAPDFARCVDIHRKPGYDPVELFLDPKQPFVKAKIFWRLLQKKMGFRMLMDVIPLDATLVKGSHGRANVAPEDQPILIDGSASNRHPEQIHATDVFGIIAAALGQPM